MIREIVAETGKEEKDVLEYYDVFLEKYTVRRHKHAASKAEAMSYYFCCCGKKARLLSDVSI